VKTGGKVTLYSRRGTDLSKRFAYVAAALASLPDETVIDGELVALDDKGKPDFANSSGEASMLSSRAKENEGATEAMSLRIQGSAELY
jgi:ATP-dependent DNA ligase